jgi:hypothetical protein
VLASISVATVLSPSVIMAQGHHNARAAHKVGAAQRLPTIDIARVSDPNCCPSGGTADIGLALKGDTLVIDSLVLRRPPTSMPTKTPGR